MDGSIRFQDKMPSLGTASSEHCKKTVLSAWSEDVCPVIRSFEAVLRLFVFLTAASLSLVALSQSLTHPEPPVLTDSPFPGNCAGPLRPQVYYSPPKSFLIDPSGRFPVRVKCTTSTTNVSGGFVFPASAGPNPL